MITDQFDRYRIILASRSPRRQELLKQTGLRFDVAVREYPETFPEGMSGRSIAEYIASRKAATFRDELADNEIVIAADTIVWCNGRILGKPADPAEAFAILKQISGNTHEVITGVTLFSCFNEKTFSVSTKVSFDILSDEEINYYIDNFAPYDKAGAYGIQEWIGLVACSGIEGSYFNVVGLPVRTLCRELEDFIKDEGRK